MGIQVSKIEKSTGVFVVAISGSIDTNTYAVLEKELDAILQCSPKAMVLDMKDVNYMSSAGVRVVLKAQRIMQKNKGEFSMVNLQPQIRKVFDIINALPDLNIFASIQELDSYLDSMQKKNE
ncbi:MAG: STAS domain-containing protein [Candidatus Omnitrophota bacterium]